MTDLDLAELERLARGATPGPWSWYAKQTVDGDSWAVFDSHDRALAMNTDGWVLDAEFIAATGPDTVLALVARVRAAEARIEKVRKLVDPDTAYGHPDDWEQGYNDACDEIHAALAEGDEQ